MRNSLCSEWIIGVKLVMQRTGDSCNLRTQQSPNSSSTTSYENLLIPYYRTVPIPEPPHSLDSRLETNYLWCYTTFRNFGIARYQSEQLPKSFSTTSHEIVLVPYYRAVSIQEPSHSLKSRLETNYLWCYTTFRNFGIATFLPYQSQQSPICSRHKVLKFYWILTTEHCLYQIHVIHLQSRLNSNYPRCNVTLKFLRAQTIWRRIQN